METKKNPKKDVHKNRALFFHIGLIISLALVISAFEWKWYGEEEALIQNTDSFEEVLDIPITDIEPPTPPQTL